MNLKDKTILITGGNSGLGFEIAKLLVPKKAKIILLSRNPERLETAREKLNTPLVSTLTCDISNGSQIKKVASEIDHVDVLINNAGVLQYGQLEDHSYEKIQKVINVNLAGSIYITKAFLPKMTEGTIVNIVSTSGLVGRPNEAVYIASKWGLRGFTEALKADLANTKIRILGFYPGGMNTPLFEKSGSNRDISSFMDPKEIAEIILFMIERPDSIKMDHVVVNRNK